MERCRLRIKIGEVEFEAEGSQIAVEAQFQVIRPYFPKPAADSGLSEAQPALSPSPPPSPPAPKAVEPAAVDAALKSILKIDERVVSVTAAPLQVGDAVLLVLYGQRVARNNQAVTGSELVRGLLSTGGVAIGRSERLFEALAMRGDIVITGRHRGKRYRLSNAGLIKARARAAALLGRA